MDRKQVREPAELSSSDPIVIEVWYCGCCGDVAAYSDRIELWCRRCAEHVIPDTGGCPARGEALDAWDRTWFAQTGHECPFG